MEEPQELTFQDLREMTDGFSEEGIVGEGAFGIVYKGVTKTGVDVAVKILRDYIQDLGYRQFRNELLNLTKVKHNNIVRVLGYCYETKPMRIEYNGRTVHAEKTHRALCFEFMHNGTLQKHLSDESCKLDWHTRYKIIKGTCEGLRYIHVEKSLVHLYLKPDNILLDENMVPKIADFGLSRIFRDKLPRTTRSPLGTIGYQPPEYINCGKISEKFDIFSLGVVIMWTVSGREGYLEYQHLAKDEFIDQILSKWREKWQETCSNGFLLEEYYHQVRTCTQIALNCMEDDSEKRPDIVKITNMLKETATDNNKETHQIVHKTVCGMERHNEIKFAKKHKVITDQYQHSNLEKGSRSNGIESYIIEETSLNVREERTVGRDEEEKNIVASLLGCIKSENIVILPIYGIGGIGKTTFARLIYDDTNFKYFSHVWVSVSQRFDSEKIYEYIISKLSGKENVQSNEQIINGILIVLDDLWEENPLEIEELKDKLYLIGNNQKIIVLVTTRSADIARRIQRNFIPYPIQALTADMCWNIIKQKCDFDARHDKEKLEDIGIEIAQKCRGVALAAKTIGSTLRSMKHDEWVTVKDSISEDTSLTQHVLASLKLSYDLSMDDFLKKCFTYCAIFPKGHKIVKYDLIYQWISLGFIKPRPTLSSLQVGVKYITRLLGLGFLQHSVLSPMTYPAYDEYDTLFMMHDLVHDLAISLLDDQILDQSKQGSIGGSSCCYALLTDCSKPLESSMSSPARLSALHFLDCRRTELHDAAFEPAESLQVLDLSECSINKLPDSIGGLKRLGYLNAPMVRDGMVRECITQLMNLRYLSLHGSWAIRALPESIGEMQGLVHLDLSGCWGIGILPESFGDLKSLDHLDLTNCENITGVSQCLGRLTKLQYLNLSGCKKIGDNPIALGSLTELQYLNLSNSSYLSANKYAEAAFLVSLAKLRYLNLSAVNLLPSIKLPEALGSLTELEYFNLSGHSNMQKLPASFGNLCNLAHLDLSFCRHLQDVQSALNCLTKLSSKKYGLTKLQYLNLYSCTGFDRIEGRQEFLSKKEEGRQEVLGSLSELRYLNIGNCNALRSSTHPDKVNSRLMQICTLTNLQYLNLSSNDGIYSIPETFSNLRKLHTLDLSSCIKLKGLPASISEIDSLKFVNTRGCWQLPRHSTSDGESSSYSFQLKYVSSVQLEISKLENVKLAKEAKTIKLVEKTHITRLTLDWTTGAKRFVDDDEEVLRELVVPPRVSEFCLKGYNSISFPFWVMHIDYYLPSLTKIVMSDLPSCNSLPPLGQLPKLELLEIRKMGSIKKIDSDLYGGTKAFRRLEYLTIDDMKSLEEWNVAYSSDDKDGFNEFAFPCLRRVEISHCPIMRFKPRPPPSYTAAPVDMSDEAMLSSCGKEVLKHVDRLDLEYHGVEHCVVKPHWRKPLVGHFPCLEYLSVRNCSDLNLACKSPDFLRGLTVCCLESVERLKDLTFLKSLEITGCESIKTLPDSKQQLIYQQTLTVSHCECMVSLPEALGDLGPLTKVEIHVCKGIKTLPHSINQLTCLQTLTISNCGSLVPLPGVLGNFASLTKLELQVCNGIKTLPDSIQQLTLLQNLTMRDCESIVSLPEWLGDLASLTTLTIESCKAIKTLPDSIQQLTRLQTLAVNRCENIVSLPGGLGNISSLKVIEIYSCDRMVTLPDSIQQLTSLERLAIWNCTKLDQWYKSNTDKMKLLPHIKRLVLESVILY